MLLEGVGSVQSNLPGQREHTLLPEGTVYLGVTSAIAELLARTEPTEFGANIPTSVPGVVSCVAETPFCVDHGKELRDQYEWQWRPNGSAGAFVPVPTRFQAELEAAFDPKHGELPQHLEFDYYDDSYDEDDFGTVTFNLPDLQATICSNDDEPAEYELTLARFLWAPFAITIWSDASVVFRHSHSYAVLHTAR